MKRYKCGDLNMHWYQDGNSCACGQIPEDVFFASNCSCGATKTTQLSPMHSPDCPYVAWAENRNAWIMKNDTEPELGTTIVRASKYYQDWNTG